ncbi:MAG: hypothetical protein WDW38_010560 [Sanguina aurantia]
MEVETSFCAGRSPTPSLLLELSTQLELVAQHLTLGSSRRSLLQHQHSGSSDGWAGFDDACTTFSATDPSCSDDADAFEPERSSCASTSPAEPRLPHAAAFVAASAVAWTPESPVRPSSEEDSEGQGRTRSPNGDGGSGSGGAPASPKATPVSPVQQHAAATSSADIGGTSSSFGTRSVDLEDGLDDALEDAVRDALGGLSNNLGAKFNMADFPLVKSISKVMHRIGGMGKPSDGSPPHGVFDNDNVFNKSVQATLERLDPHLGGSLHSMGHHLSAMDPGHLMTAAVHRKRTRRQGVRAPLFCRPTLDLYWVRSHRLLRPGHLLPGIPSVLKICAALESSWTLDLAMLPLVAPFVAAAVNHVRENSEKVQALPSLAAYSLAAHSASGAEGIAVAFNSATHDFFSPQAKDMSCEGLCLQA